MKMNRTNRGILAAAASIAMLVTAYQSLSVVVRKEYKGPELVIEQAEQPKITLDFILIGTDVRKITPNPPYTSWERKRYHLIDSNRTHYKLCDDKIMKGDELIDGFFSDGNDSDERFDGFYAWNRYGEDLGYGDISIERRVSLEPVWYRITREETLKQAGL